LNYQNNYL